MRWSKSCENVHPPALTGTAPINHKPASLVLRLANLNFRMLRRRALPSCFQYRGDDLRLNLDGSDLWADTRSQEGIAVLDTCLSNAQLANVDLHLGGLRNKC